MMTRTATMPNLRELHSLIEIVDARLALIGSTDPARTAELQERRDDLLRQIAERSANRAQRLPYKEGE